MIGEDKAKVKAGQIRENGTNARDFLNLEEANGSEIVHVQEEPVRNLLQAGSSKRPEDGRSHGENVERWLGSANANGTQWRAESSQAICEERLHHRFL
jgi:hypothetical protein